MLATQPQSVTKDQIMQVVDVIAKQFRPHQVILFGSYAYGEPNLESDVDLLVVMDTALKELKQAVQIYQVIPHLFPIDVIVRTPVNLKQRLDWGDFFLREIISKGQVLYENNYT